jgi:glycosyltransferase involved in cell wall biosynthesis
MNYKKKAAVSIGMAVYNEARWIKQALDSLLAQTFDKFELIISDNASTDETWNILQEYTAKDTRITLYRQPENIGAIENFEFVLAQAAGEYFIWASGHDLWSGNLLEVLLKELQDNPRLVLCAPQGVLIDDDNCPIMVYDEAIDTRSEQSAAGRIFVMHRQLKRSNAIYGLHRRDVLLKTLPWPRVVGGDSVILVRIAALGDVLTNPAAQWFRRRNRQQTSFETARHRVHVLKLSNLAADFPLFVTRVIVIREFFKARGSPRDRIRLLIYGFKRLFLSSGQRQLFIKEFFFAGTKFVQSSSKAK